MIFQWLAKGVAVPFHGFSSMYLAATFFFLNGTFFFFLLFSLIILAHDMMEQRLDDSVRLMTKGEEVEDVGDTQVGGVGECYSRCTGFSNKIRWQDGGN